MVPMLAAAVTYPNPWRWVPHPEVWALVLFLAGAYIYLARVIGPKAVPAGQRPVSRKQITAFVFAVLLLWIGADWPVHDIGENYLYCVHMFQHMVFSYFVPPLALLATPEWMWRTLIGTGRTYRVISRMMHPVFAGLVFNAVVMVTHIPAVVNTSTTIGPLHYSLHLLLMVTALWMWTPICGPFQEWRLGYGARCAYLFLMSVVPTVPAGWLTFAEGVVYKHYAQPVRVWGLSVTDDQQIAGAIMKIGGGFFLWGIVIFMFFARFGRGWEKDQTYRRERPPVVDPALPDDVLTFEHVSQAFEASSPPVVEAEQGAGDQRRHD
jgi:putative membrane protein